MPATILASLGGKLSTRRVICLVLFWQSVTILTQAQPNAVRPNPQAEQYVRAQLTKGKSADLEVGFHNPSDRGLGSDFLYELLTKPNNNLGLPREVVSILHAIFPQGLNLRNADVALDVTLSHCSFGYLDFSRSHFRK